MMKSTIILGALRIKPCVIRTTSGGTTLALKKSGCVRGLQIRKHRDEEITDEVYELKRMEKGKNVEETRNSPIPTPIRSPRIHTNLVSSDTEKLQELTDTPHTTTSIKLLRSPQDIMDDPHDDAHLKGENSAKWQKTSEYEAYVSGESSSGQYQQDITGRRIRIPVDEAKLRKMADEMLRQRCTSGDEAVQKFLSTSHPQKGTTPLVHSCQKDPEAPALSLINQDLLYLITVNSDPEDSFCHFISIPAIYFNDDDIKERTSRWVNKSVKKFNPYARYGVEHWKNPHAKIFYIRK
ncbi:hypothetical protein Tco_0971527 [Tanacetum coccineum]